MGIVTTLDAPYDEAAESSLTDIRAELSFRRATRPIFERALQLAISSHWQEAKFGIDVLADFGPKSNFPWRDETVSALIAGTHRREPELVSAAISALGRFGPNEALAHVLEHRSNTKQSVRWSLACALPGFAEGLVSEAHPAVRALIDLSHDEDSQVRDWATFGFGTQTETDGPTIRNALMERLDDEDSNTRHEALVGLARRHDRRALPALVRALSNEFVADLAIRSAEYLGAPEALTTLRTLAESPNWSLEESGDAIERCDPVCQSLLYERLGHFMSLAESSGLALACYSDRLPHDSGGPQITVFKTNGCNGRAHNWSFEELLERADHVVEAALSLVQADLNRDQGS